MTDIIRIGNFSGIVTSFNFLKKSRPVRIFFSYRFLDYTFVQHVFYDLVYDGFFFVVNRILPCIDWRMLLGVNIPRYTAFKLV